MLSLSLLFRRVALRPPTKQFIRTFATQNNTTKSKVENDEIFEEEEGEIDEIEELEKEDEILEEKKSKPLDEDGEEDHSAPLDPDIGKEFDEEELFNDSANRLASENFKGVVETKYYLERTKIIVRTVRNNYFAVNPFQNMSVASDKTANEKLGHNHNTKMAVLEDSDHKAAIMRQKLYLMRKGISNYDLQLWSAHHEGYSRDIFPPPALAFHASKTSFDNAYKFYEKTKYIELENENDPEAEVELQNHDKITQLLNENFKESDPKYWTVRNTAVALQNADPNMPWNKRIKWFQNYIKYSKTGDIIHVLPNSKAKSFHRRFGHIRFHERLP